MQLSIRPVDIRLIDNLNDDRHTFSALFEVSLLLSILECFGIPARGNILSMDMLSIGYEILHSSGDYGFRQKLFKEILKRNNVELPKHIKEYNSQSAYSTDLDVDLDNSLLLQINVSNKYLEFRLVDKETTSYCAKLEIHMLDSNQSVLKLFNEFKATYSASVMWKLIHLISAPELERSVPNYFGYTLEPFLRMLEGKFDIDRKINLGFPIEQPKKDQI